MASQIIKYFHKLLIANPQVPQDSRPFFSIFSDIAENGFGKVLHHIFSLCLLLLETRFDFPHLTIRLRFKDRTVRLVLEVNIVLHLFLRKNALILLDDFDIIFSHVRSALSR